MEMIKWLCGVDGEKGFLDESDGVRARWKDRKWRDVSLVMMKLGLERG